MWEIYGVGIVHGAVFVIALERVVLPIIVSWTQRRRARQQIVLPD